MVHASLKRSMNKQSSPTEILSLRDSTVCTQADYNYIVRGNVTVIVYMYNYHVECYREIQRKKDTVSRGQKERRNIYSRNERTRILYK